MVLSKHISIVSISYLIIMQQCVFGDVTVERSERGVVVKVDGVMFTEYLAKEGESPAMWPIIGPTGKPMTRSYPIGPKVEGESIEHPNHQSVWFAHGLVNGADFWRTYRHVMAGKSGAALKHRPTVAHRKFLAIDDHGSTARIVTCNDWMIRDRRVCEDERVLVCGTRPNGDRWIDLTVTIKATEGDVKFGDTEEGTFGVRVADSMTLTSKKGGRIVNSEGQVDDDAWGRLAKWVDYSGPIDTTGNGSEASDSQIVGIAIFSHPSAFRPVPRWHVRGYGLFAVNPFGESDFPMPEAARQGGVTIKKGDSLTLRYRVLFHRGATEQADIPAAFDEFAAQ